MSDDGYIYIRVVNQLLAGHGPVFNQGERVETTASPLWLGILSAAKLVLQPVSAPWIAVVLGLLLSVIGLAFAQWGAYRLWQAEGRIVLPLGAAIVVALPPFWEFATSGLETGLAFAWLGACFWGMVRLRSARGEPDGPAHAERGKAPPAGLAVLVGLGVLIRPDFALFVGAFVIVLFLFCPGRPILMRTAALALAIPLAYQIFRMGYYGALVPNPAFVKEASSSDWARGWVYLTDTMKPYWLPLPLALALVGGLAPWPLRAAGRLPRPTERGLIVAVVLSAALAHGLYTVYVGGDFMHARFLLPAIFALVMPVAVIGLDATPRVLAVAGVLIWAVVCAAVLRVPYREVGPDLIANERGYYVSLAEVSHPITLDDYRSSFYAEIARSARAQLLPKHLMVLWPRNAQVCPIDLTCFQVPLRPGSPLDGAIAWPTIGIFSNVVGTDRQVVDVIGLADAFGSHLELVQRRRAGHEKPQPTAWILARFADPAAPLPAGGPTAADVSVARGALNCGRIPALVAAVSDPMTPKRFARNLLEAFRLYRFRIPPNPYEASETLC